MSRDKALGTQKYIIHCLNKWYRVCTVERNKKCTEHQDIYYLSSNSTAWYLADWSKCHFSDKRNINSGKQKQKRKNATTIHASHLKLITQLLTSQEVIMQLLAVPGVNYTAINHLRS